MENKIIEKQTMGPFVNNLLAQEPKGVEKAIRYLYNTPKDIRERRTKNGF